MAEHAACTKQAVEVVVLLLFACSTSAFALAEVSQPLRKPLMRQSVALSIDQDGGIDNVARVELPNKHELSLQERPKSSEAAMPQLGKNIVPDKDELVASKSKATSTGQTKGATASATAINLYLDGQTPIPAPRTVLDHFPREILYQIHKGIDNVNATHAFLPSKPLHGKFVRSTHVSGSYEFGTVEQRWGVNPMSVFPDVVFGAAERMRTLYHEGAWPDDSLKRVQEEQKNRWSITDIAAKSLNRIRIFKQFLYIMKAKAGSQMTGAAVDPTHTARLQDFASQDSGHPSQFLESRKSLLVQNLTEQDAQADSDPSSAASNCYHLQQHAGIQITEEGAWVPLNTKLVSFKGSMVFSPQQHVDFTTGITVFSYDAGILSIYLAGSSLLDVVQPERTDASSFAASAGFYMSPADGESGKDTIPADERVQDIGPSAIVHAMYHAATLFPIDYSYLYQDEKVLCPDEKLAELEGEAEEMDLMMVKNGEASLLETKDLIEHLVDVLDCGTTFLRAVPRGSNGVGFLEIITWAHFLMEFPPARRMQGVYNWTV